MIEIIPQDELNTLPPREWFKGKSVVELGNKKNQNGLYRDWYKEHGAQYVCLDWNAEDGALPLDMGKDIQEDAIAAHLIGHGDILTNFGFTEHVYTNQKQCWKNVLLLASRTESYVSLVLPYPGQWEHHGVYQPTLDWLIEFFTSNGFEILVARVNKDRRRWVNCIKAKRVDPFLTIKFFYPETKYVPPSDGIPYGKGIYITAPSRRVNPGEKNCGVTP
jgi:hypothetical protein